MTKLLVGLAGLTITSLVGKEYATYCLNKPNQTAESAKEDLMKTYAILGIGVIATIIVVRKIKN